MADTILDDPTPPPADPALAPPVDLTPPAPADPAGDPPPPADPAGDTPPASDFEKDWRSALSKGDGDLLKFLGRYQSPDSAIKKFKEINDDIKAGKYRKPIGDDATDEEKAAYRKEQGIPDTADGYYDKLPEGLVVGDDDKPFVGKFLAEMHAVDAPPAMVNAALDSYYAILQEQAETQADVARQAEQAGVEALRGEWGADYKRNLNVMHSYLDTLPKPVAEAFRFGKGGDGVPLGYNPEVLKWLTGQALEANPVATLVPGAGANQASAIADEMAEIEGIMRSDRDRYNKDDKMQARYRELITGKMKLEGKA